jgi:hypothetical protein
MVGCISRWVKTPIDTHQRRVINMADIGMKIKGAATKAAKDKVSGEKKGKGTRGSKSGVDKAEKALKNRLK